MGVNISGLLAAEECKSGDNYGRLHSLPSEYSRYYILYSVFMVSFVCLICCDPKDTIRNEISTLT